MIKVFSILVVMFVVSSFGYAQAPQVCSPAQTYAPVVVTGDTVFLGARVVGEPVRNVLRGVFNCFRRARANSVLVTTPYTYTYVETWGIPRSRSVRVNY